MTTPSLLDTLLRAGVIRGVDHALGQALRRHAPATHPLVAAGAALAAQAVDAGHAAFDPARRPALPDGIAWPAPAHWHEAWRADTRWTAHPRAGDASDALPLVHEHGLLYLRRYREYERDLARGLHRIAAHDAPQADVAAARDALFPAGGDDDQRAAADAALAHALLVVTGGPGTGKTTTVARVLALLVAQAFALGRPAPRIALAAPTGRAAERMAASLRRAREAMRGDPAVDPRLPEALPVHASTLHRLLGPIRDSARFRHDAAHPLPADVVVVDEASMVDLPMMAKLVDAIGPGTRLLLLGDADQLPSVDAGDVLAALVDAAGAGANIAHVHLRRGWRQAGGFELAPLSAALRAGEADRALALLRGGALQGVAFDGDAHDVLEVPGLLAHFAALRGMDDPAAALAHADALRVLTAVRAGPQGAVSINARIARALHGPAHALHFAGRLLLVTANSPRHGLSNGDIGVCLPDGADRLAAWFAGPDGPRAFDPAGLPPHESAFASTVHKAQGSEHDHVVLQLPARDARVASRALLYTAATRARGSLRVRGGEAVLRAALARADRRTSALAARLTRG